VVVSVVRAHEPRIAFGNGVGTVVCAPATERVLADGSSIDDAHTVPTAEYRLRVAGNLLRRRWAETG
jgi:hypothetical protein